MISGDAFRKAIERGDGACLELGEALELRERGILRRTDLEVDLVRAPPTFAVAEPTP